MPDRKDKDLDREEKIQRLSLVRIQIWLLKLRIKSEPNIYFLWL